MSSRAKVYWARKIVMHSTFEYNVPYVIGNLTVFDERICTKLNATLRYSIESGNIADYWIDLKTIYTEQEYFQVDWEANSGTIKLSIAKRY